MNVYFAGPLFSQAEKDFNLKIATVLEEFGYYVFLPQRDGFEAAILNGLTGKQKSEKIFNKDISEINNAAILFMIIDGCVPDDGTCVELGYAFAKNKRCYGYKTDTRSFMDDLSINPMLSGCFKKVFQDENDKNAETNLREFLLKNTL